MEIKEILQKSKEINDPAIAVIKYFRAIEDLKSELKTYIDEQVETDEIKDELEEQIKKIEEKIESIKTVFEVKLEKIKPTEGLDKLETRLKEEIKDKISIILELIKKEPEKQTYSLTENDKKDIASLVKIPTIEKVTEIVKEPTITNEIREVAKYEEAEQIANKLNTLENKIDRKVIKGLEKDIANLTKLISETRRQKGGGGMSNLQHETTATSSATTTVTATQNIAGGGYALWVYYQGQHLARGTAYTVSGRTLTLLFTPEDNTYIDLVYFRA